MVRDIPSSMFLPLLACLVLDLRLMFGSTRIFLRLDWDFEPGRTAGCFDAKLRGCFVPYVDRSMEEIEIGFYELRKKWDLSEAKLQLQEHMSRIIQNHRHRLERVISFGTGSFQSVADCSRRATSFQILAQLTMF